MRNISIAAIALLAAATTARAQSGRLELLEGSSLSISGTSTLRKWSCRTSALNSTLALGKNDINPLGAGSGARGEVDILVKTLKCGQKTMDQHMYKALKADEFPTIGYTLGKYELLPGATQDSVNVRTTGMLKIAGTSKEITMEVRASRAEGNLVKATGSVQLLMTDFGVKPPVVMMGMLKTGNQITVSFDLRTHIAPIVAAAHAADGGVAIR